MSNEKVKAYRGRMLAKSAERAAKGLPPKVYGVGDRAAGGPVESRVRHGVAGACAHLGPATGGTASCPSCDGKRVELKVFGCAVHGECTMGKKADGVAGCCRGCPDYLPPD